MWQNKLKEIIYILENSNVNEIEISFWGRKYRVSKQASVLMQETQGQVHHIPKDNKEIQTNISTNELVDSGDENIDKGETLLSPMPGTFYSAPTPDDAPFVSIGDKVKKGQILCIIEAMKIMNEIESEYDGIIKSIKVNNGDSVEYNQILFIIQPS
tara:strand:+ start:777 stop:1244 length:468 start_codon:yes stop_codon:yes gene_type:complete